MQMQYANLKGPAGLKGGSLHYGTPYWQGVDNTMVILYSASSQPQQRLAIFTYHDYHRDQVIWTEMAPLDLQLKGFWSQFIRAMEFAEETAAVELSGNPPKSWEEARRRIAGLKGVEIRDKTYLVFHHAFAPQQGPAYDTLMDFAGLPIDNLSVILLYDDFVAAGESGYLWSSSMSDPQLQLHTTTVRLYLLGHGVLVGNRVADRIFHLTLGWAPMVDMLEQVLKKDVLINEDDVDAAIMPLFQMMAQRLLEPMEEGMRQLLDRLSVKQVFTVPDACTLTGLPEGRLRQLCKTIPLLRERPDNNSYVFHPLFYQHLWMQRVT